MTDEIVAQIVEIRDTGLTNMFDVRRVCELADAYGFDALADYIKQDRNAYCHFILTGKR